MGSGAVQRGESWDSHRVHTAPGAEPEFGIFVWLLGLSTCAALVPKLLLYEGHCVGIQT